MYNRAKIQFEKKKHVLYENLIHVAPINPYEIELLLTNLNIKKFRTDKGDTLLISDYKRFLKSKEYHEAKIIQLKVNVENYHKNLTTENITHIREQIETEISKAKYYIDKLSGIHSNYSNKFDFINEKSPLFASYLVFSRIISLLYSICNSITSFDINVLIFLRPLSEALSLSEYFLLSKNDTHLNEWFNEEMIPSDRVFSKAKEEYYKKFNPDALTKIMNNLKSTLLYQLSKSIHSSYKSVSKLSIYKIEDNKLMFSKFEYSKSQDYFELLSITHFMQSILLEAFQSFYMCYVIITQLLSDDDIEVIDALILELQEITTKNY